MKYLLDTNVVSELRRPLKADRCVVAWVNARQATDCHISVVTLAEIVAGALAKSKADARQGAMLMEWIDKQVRPQFDGRVVPINEVIAIQAAGFHARLQRPFHDSYIAASASVLSLCVVTRNIRDFEGTGVQVLNPWEVDAIARPA